MESFSHLKVFRDLSLHILALWLHFLEVGDQAESKSKKHYPQ